MPQTTIKTKQINKITVTPVVASGGEPDPSKIKGYEYIPLLYANIFLCAKKKSGKTNVIFNLLEHLAGPKTMVYLFASTVHKDATYAAIMKMLKKKNISFEANTAFFEKGKKSDMITDIISNSKDVEKTVVFEKTPKGKKLTVGEANLKSRQTSHKYTLEDLRQNYTEPWDKFYSTYTRIRGEPLKASTVRRALRRQGEMVIDEPGLDFAPPTYDKRTDPTQRKYRPVFGDPEVKLKRGVVFGDPAIKPYEEADFIDYADYQAPVRKHSGEMQAPEVIFVFDDLGGDLRHPAIAQLLKTNRHEKAKVILSSQYLTDLQPQSIKQLDYCMLFKAFGDDKLRKIYELFDFSVDYGKFADVYKYATEAPFSFLYIDVRTEQFRKNFNLKLSVSGTGQTNVNKELEKKKPETEATAKSKKSNKDSDEEVTNDTDDATDDENDNDQSHRKKSRRY